MTPNASPAPEFRLTGWHVLAGVTTFFAIVIGVDASFLIAAYRSHPGEVSVTPYEDGLLYNQRIAQLEAQSRLGWTASARAGPGEVAMVFQDRRGAPVRGLRITGRLERPATESGRIELAFTEAGPGRYVAHAGAQAGAWDLTAAAQAADGARFIAERRLTWR